MSPQRRTALVSVVAAAALIALKLGTGLATHSLGLLSEAARRTYRLPYFHARMSASRSGEWIAYECARLSEGGRVFSGRYRPSGAVATAALGSLEWFLAERYCLYTTDQRGTLARAEIHHELWPLQPAEAEIELTSISPLELNGDPLLHFSRRQDVVIWPLGRVAP